MDHILTSISWNTSNWSDPKAEFSKFRYPQDSGTLGAEGRNFDPKANVSDGFKRGYFPQNRYHATSKKPNNGSWCVVFTSTKPSKPGRGRFIVGIYLNAEVGDFKGRNIQVLQDDVVSLEPGKYLSFDNDRHCRNKKAVRTLVYIDDVDLKVIFDDLLKLYEGHERIERQLRGYSKSV